ncbi:hypothetical protein ACQJBY_007770 [Aegilops geniculata]
MADELRAAQHEIDMFIRLIPLIALVDNSTADSRRVKLTKIRIQGATELCNAGEQPFVGKHLSEFPIGLNHGLGYMESNRLKFHVNVIICESGKVDLREQNIVDIEELVELCTRMEEACSGFTRFNFCQILDPTENFSENMIIGWGGFGRVYKGQLPGGLNVAIKRADEHAAMLEVNSELQLAKLQHANVIRLLGWCIHGKERILVYEFMQNGSLDCYLCDFNLTSSNYRAQS